MSSWMMLAQAEEAAPIHMSHTLDEKQRRTEALVRAHRASLLRIARKLCGNSHVDPEDLVQETLERALANLDRLEERGVESREAWLGATLTNRFLDHCRRRQTEARALPLLSVVQEQEVSLEGTPGGSWAQVSDEALQGAIDRLEARHREAYVLHAQGYKYQAISREMGIPMGTVATWLYQARQQLRRLLSPGSEPEDESQEVRGS
jgi:RNA polymerase sigma-70 factor (ECF subfamily)